MASVGLEEHEIWDLVKTVADSYKLRRSMTLNLREHIAFSVSYATKKFKREASQGLEKT